MAARYAVYYCPPPDSPLGVFGRRWFGRDERAAPVPDRLVPAGLDPARLDALIATPSVYGFHATLKAPFRLADGASVRELREAVGAFAASRRAFAAPHLALASLGGFIALVPSAPAPGLHDLADACVTEFDAFRAPPDAGELAKRRAAGLSPRQETLLTQWGYPYVFDQFRFHMTLTDAIADDAERLATRDAIAPLVADLCSGPLTVDAICLCRQDAPGAPFVVEMRAALASRRAAP